MKSIRETAVGLLCKNILSTAEVTYILSWWKERSGKLRNKCFWSSSVLGSFRINVEVPTIQSVRLKIIAYVRYGSWQCAVTQSWKCRSKYKMVYCALIA